MTIPEFDLNKDCVICGKLIEGDDLVEFKGVYIGHKLCVKRLPRGAK